jgi:polo-like kinase 1
MKEEGGGANTSPNMGGKSQPIVYVKKWMRTKHAIMFRLSNKIVQVSFQDHTEILLNSESRLVTYVNKKAERQTLPLN